jgi:hypothetical protein
MGAIIRWAGVQTGSQVSRAMHTQALAIGSRHDVQVGFRLQCLYTRFCSFHEVQAWIDSRLDDLALLAETVKVPESAVCWHLTNCGITTNANVLEVRI